jgi:hypothetical protein
MKRTLALVLVAVISAGRVDAHEKEVHQAIPMLAYEIMRLAERDRTLLATTGTLPPGVTAADWNDFRAEMVAAAPAVRRFAPGFSGLPQTCVVVRNGADQALPAGFNQWSEMSAVDEPLGPNYPQGRDCGVLDQWAPDGIYTGGNGGVGTDYTGLTLGHFAASVDDELDDTHLWYRPTHLSPPIPGFTSPIEIAEALDKGLDLGLTVLLAPFVCLVDLINGGGNCLSHANDIANHINPVDDLVGSIPGIGDHTSLDYVGFWHHINVAPFRSNTYDDVQGLYLDEATLFGRLDLAELAVIAYADTLGQGLHYRPSNGPKRYQVARGRDGHADTRMRSDAEWQFLNWPHTPMEPLDNLAWWGWERFRSAQPPAGSGRPARYLGWPLHALGDAAAPHHVIGAPGWGHAPMEFAVRDAWPAIRFNVAGSPDLPAQRTQARRIFSRALRWRKLILDWRAADPIARRGTVPVRDLVTALARETHDDSVLKTLTTAWPYDPVSSAVFFLDDSNFTNHKRADLPDLARPQLENAVGATIALLTYATEVK